MLRRAGQHRRHSLGSSIRLGLGVVAAASSSMTPAGRHKGRWRARLAVITTLTMLAGALVAANGVAAADASPYPPADLLNLSALQLPATPPDGGSFYPAGVYSATPAEITSLQDLESQAVTDTIQDHSLSPGDTGAVESWARPDADAELWGLLVQAINAVGAGTATTDQQNADAWLTAVMQREDVLAAQDAGLEYAKWAGLGSERVPDPTQQQPERERPGVVPFGYTRAVRRRGFDFDPGVDIQ